MRFKSALAILALCAASLSHADFFARADLGGISEVPPNSSLATGLAQAFYDSSADTLSLDVTFSGLISAATAAHIQFGAVGVNGPVIVPLSVFPNATSGTYSRTFTSSDFLTSPSNGINSWGDVIDAVKAGDTYVNIHDSVYPGGEIRGQLEVVPEPATMAALALGVAPLLKRRRRA